ncbi:MAG: hypothetical protein QM726_17060 [Chitinophagaceae bacterium]
METKLQAETKFKASDAALEELVKARREEVVALQKATAARIEEMEKKGQASIKALRKTLPKEMIASLDQQEQLHKDATDATAAWVEEARAKLRSTTPASENGKGFNPEQIPAERAIGFFKPYYGTLHGSDGKVSWQGYNPGNIDLSDFANGGGSGLFGTGAGSFTVYMDWWFTFRAPENRNYAHTIYVPMHGFYILKSDDGFWDSKEAHARIDLSAIGYQYNYKANATTNVFDIDSQNINVNDRFDGTRVMYYSDLLGADTAYLRVTASFYVYARGGGSTAQLNFASGAANYVGIPSVYVV